MLGRLSAVKPVAVLKAGTTPAGKKAAASHTGSLAGSDAAWSAIFSQSRAIRVDSLDELVDMMVTFRFMPVPPKGKRIATMGVGGGVSVLATDECHTVGFVMPPLDEAVKRGLTRDITNDAGVMLGNPIDFPFWAMGEEQFRDAMRTLLKWEGIDLFLFLAPLRQSEPQLADYRALRGVPVEQPDQGGRRVRQADSRGHQLPGHRAELAGSRGVAAEVLRGGAAHLPFHGQRAEGHRAADPVPPDASEVL